MVECSRHRVEYDKERAQACADDDSNKCLPPRQSKSDHGAACQIGRYVGVRKHPEVVECPEL